MAALIKGRLTPRRDGDYREASLAATAVVFAGAMVMRNASGFLSQGQTAADLVGVGVAEADANNADGADGDAFVRYRLGSFRLENSTAADEITIADIGQVAFAVDDQTVAKTDGGATRSPAGIIDDVDAGGVWVRFDEALTNAS